MQDKLVSKETAVKAKACRFDCSTNYMFYAENLGAEFDDGARNWNETNRYLSAPTQSLLARWLREEKNLNITVQPGKWHNFTNCGWDWFLTDLKGSNFGHISQSEDVFDTFELAMEAGLQQALKLC